MIYYFSELFNLRIITFLYAGIFATLRCSSGSFPGDSSDLVPSDMKRRLEELVITSTSSGYVYLSNRKINYCIGRSILWFYLYGDNPQARRRRNHNMVEKGVHAVRWVKLDFVV